MRDQCCSGEFTPIISVGFWDKTTWNECGISVAVVNLHPIISVGFWDKTTWNECGISVAMVNLHPINRFLG